MLDDARGYGPAVLQRLKRALEQHCPAWPDPRHPRMFFVEADQESFYIATLPSGKILLLGNWRG